jgi:hypothetical protein
MYFQLKETVSKTQACILPVNFIFIITLVLLLAGQGIAGVSSNCHLFIPHSGQLTDTVQSSVRSNPVHTATAYKLLTNKLEFICRKKKTPFCKTSFFIHYDYANALEYLYLHTLYTRQCLFDVFLHIHIYNSCKLFSSIPTLNLQFLCSVSLINSYYCFLLLYCSIIITIIINNANAVVGEISDCVSVNFCLVDSEGRMVSYSADMHIHKQLQCSGSRYSIQKASITTIRSTQMIGNWMSWLSHSCYHPTVWMKWLIKWLYITVLYTLWITVSWAISEFVGYSHNSHVL